jgi:hypothetical protein
MRAARPAVLARRADPARLALLAETTTWWMRIIPK